MKKVNEMVWERRSEDGQVGSVVAGAVARVGEASRHGGASGSREQEGMSGKVGTVSVTGSDGSGPGGPAMVRLRGAGWDKVWTWTEAWPRSEVMVADVIGDDGRGSWTAWCRVVEVWVGVRGDGGRPEQSCGLARMFEGFRRHQSSATVEARGKGVASPGQHGLWGPLWTARPVPSRVLRENR